MTLLSTSEIFDSEDDRQILAELIKDMPEPDTCEAFMDGSTRTSWIYSYPDRPRADICLELNNDSIIIGNIRGLDDGSADLSNEKMNMKFADPRCTPQFIRAKLKEALDEEEKFAHEYADEQRNNHQKGGT